MATDDEAPPPPAPSTSIPVAPPAKTPMGPPAAPASMFWRFESSARAKDPADQLDSLYILHRLAAVVVILFRAGDIRYAQVIGQLAVDLFGKAAWEESLPPYLRSWPEPGDGEAVDGLLREACGALKMVDLLNAGFLEGVLATMD